MDIGTGRAILFLYVCYRENVWHFESKSRIGNISLLYHGVHNFQSCHSCTTAFGTLLHQKCTLKHL